LHSVRGVGQSDFVLRHLRVTNFAILSDVTVELGAGLGVLTGETGAGKSLIVEAVNLLRGGRASADIPRAGASEATVEAIIEVPIDLRARVLAVLEQAGLPLAADDAVAGAEVVIRRVILRGGRSRTYVNGALTTAGRLAELGAWLIDLSGQHQHQGLVDPGRHRAILDAFADQPSLTSAMTTAWDALGQIDAQIAGLGGDDRQRAERADFVRFQLDELEGARLDAGEEPRLALERVRLLATEELRQGSRVAVTALDGDGNGALDGLAIATREVEKLARIDRGLEPVAQQLREAHVVADDAASALRRYVDRIDGDPERLAAIDDRLELLRRLRRKHAGSDLIARASELRTELQTLVHRDAHLETLHQQRRAAYHAAEGAAAALTASRSAAGARLVHEVGAALTELGMAAARLDVRMQPAPLASHGADEIEMLLAANKGEDYKPLSKVASGGELSRIMLALKLALRRADEVATYVFDEVDAGIGGATAHAVGALIRAVADHRQVLCVTHLPQIAAYADAHYLVEKVEQAGRTETLVTRLGAGARKDELARMLGGSATTRAKAHAAELLAGTRRSRAHA
jgi:DNA repair protein RecN (Recombination protein N)